MVARGKLRKTRRSRSPSDSWISRTTGYTWPHCRHSKSAYSTTVTAAEGEPREWSRSLTGEPSSITSSSLMRLPARRAGRSRLPMGMNEPPPRALETCSRAETSSRRCSKKGLTNCDRIPIGNSLSQPGSCSVISTRDHAADARRQEACAEKGLRDLRLPPEPSRASKYGMAANKLAMAPVCWGVRACPPSSPEWFEILCISRGRRSCRLTDARFLHSARDNLRSPA